MTDYKFQVNLGGVIDLLSNHIYSSPQVFVRELLQNAVDAIVARAHREPGFRGEVTIELPRAGAGGRPSLVFRDNGVGLTEEEVHRFLATIGQTSKRDELAERRADFIGQFGIGLLSCFVVSEEIVVLTRSSAGGPAVEWRGRSDGTYTLKALGVDAEQGTEVRLTCKPGSEEHFDADAVRRLARHYGGLLPYPIRLVTPSGSERVNDERPPWEQKFDDADVEREAYLEYGRRMFGADFLDYVPLASRVGDVRGAAYVLPYSPSLAARKTHRVYLKNMLLSETAEGLLPDWAFFVKCVVNAQELRPTASRESFYEDEALSQTREALGRCLREYLVGLASADVVRLKKLIALHFLSIKALAAADEEFFRIFVKWLPFETNMGTMTLTEYRREHDVVRYTPDMDQFRQIARVAASQSLCVINAGYSYDAQLLLKLYEVFPGVRLAQVDGESLSRAFEYLTLEEEEEAADFLEFAARLLRPFRCAAEVRKFTPGDIPALYTETGDAQFRRTVEKTKEVTDAFWSSVLDEVAGAAADEEAGLLCFNYRNPVVRKVCRVQDETLRRLSVQVLYVQALLLGHRALSAEEMRLLNEGMLGLVEWGADAVEGWIQ
ncbi:MAG TPA: HSP90 family protein [Pyrinomonadaceae bacterium]|nr:HSP90 family protein [Pyrinomonadaceae bacterium]